MFANSDSTYFDEQVSNSVNFPMFITACLRLQRVTTVIAGIPFYRSTGKNSGFPNTWFPYRGIDDNKWVMKPKEPDFPEDIVKFFNDLDIKEFNLKRFANLICLKISAAIGGGFWETEAGKTFHEFLTIKYPNIVFPQTMIDELNARKDDPKLEVVTSISETNSRLIAMDSLITPNVTTSRFPAIDEYPYFSREHSSAVHQALKLLLTTEVKITDYYYHLLIELDKYPQLFKTVLANHLLEDTHEAQKLFTLLKTTSDFSAINEKMLTNLSFLRKLSATELKMIPDDFLVKQNNRNLLRDLLKKDNLHPHIIKLLHKLHSLNLLMANPLLVRDEDALYFLSQYLQNDKLTDTVYRNIEKLFKENLLNDCITLIKLGKVANNSDENRHLIYHFAKDYNSNDSKSFGIFSRII